MSRKKVTKIHCDFCDREIEKSTPSVIDTVLPDNAGKPLGVEVRVFWPDGKRFTDDVCSKCVWAFAREAGEQPAASVPGLAYIIDGRKQPSIEEENPPTVPVEQGVGNSPWKPDPKAEPAKKGSDVPF